MTRSNFLENLSKMTHDDILAFIKDKGKYKEPQCYNCPWYIDLDKLKDNDDNSNEVPNQ